jgi:hypothetical protein
MFNNKESIYDQENQGSSTKSLCAEKKTNPCMPTA